MKQRTEDPPRLGVALVSLRNLRDRRQFKGKKPCFTGSTPSEQGDMFEFCRRVTLRGYVSGLTCSDFQVYIYIYIYIREFTSNGTIALNCTHSFVLYHLCSCIAFIFIFIELWMGGKIK